MSGLGGKQTLAAPTPLQEDCDVGHPLWMHIVVAHFNWDVVRGFSQSADYVRNGSTAVKTYSASRSISTRPKTVHTQTSPLLY